MLKAVLAATAAVTIAGSSLAYAQRDERAPEARRWQPTTEDMRAFQAARLAALRAGLVLNSEQEKHWPAFEQAMRDLQQFRLNRVTAIREARRDGRPQVTDPAERMRERATRLSESGAVLQRLAEATDPLYRSLDDAQKRRFVLLTRGQGPRGWGWHRRSRDGGEGGMPRGHHRTDASPADAVQNLADNRGDLFTRVFVGKAHDGIVAGRMFGAKTANGDLAVGEAVFAGKSFVGQQVLEPAAFGDKHAAIAPGMFSGKLIAPEGATFGRKIAIGEQPVFGRKVVSNI